MDQSDIEEIEVNLFREAILKRHGYDFSGYAQASFKRRVIGLRDSLGLRSVTELIEKMLHDDDRILDIIGGLSVPVSDMFRDPLTFRRLREEVMPMLATWPEINIWQAGCANGEEVYSLAILLKECKLYERARIYATDFNQHALDRAAEGIYSLRDARTYSENYLKAGGLSTLSDWFTAGYSRIRMDPSLRERVLFTNHNLVSDSVFGEMQLVVCRNVLIYFRDQLQDRALGLFRDSLVHGGYLCLGNRESLDYSSVVEDFSVVDLSNSIYRRVVHD